ncbi:TPA: XkdX family protein [Clostridioides difficile]|nr:XkdX family protein [Clostridioides difficile]HBH1637306.1 XkdX family protein [Clostridioides difficile]
MEDKVNSTEQTIADFYNNGNWTKEQVKKAVEKNKITTIEYKEIVGEDYIV